MNGLGTKLRNLLFSDSNISIIAGNLGTGKTLFATLYAVENANYYDKIYANYKINLNNAEVTKHIAYVFTSDKREKKLLILDEAYLLIDSRRSSSKKNVLVYDTLRLARKHNVHIILISQIYSAIDIRLRKLASSVIICKNENKILINKNNLMIIDLLKKFSNKAYTIKITNVQKYFEYYDSYEDVESMEVIE